MGTVANQYLLLGVKLAYDAVLPALEHKIEKENLNREDYDDIRFNFLEPYMDNGYQEAVKHHNGLFVINDGMNGEYLFIGRLIAKTKPGRMLDGIFDLNNTEEKETIKQIVTELIQAQFGIENQPVGLWLIAHYH